MSPLLAPALAACVLSALGAGAARAAQGGLRVVDSAAETAPLERVAQALDAVDQTGVAPAFVEIQTPRTEAFVGELVALEVRFGLDAEFLEREVVPLFRRRLDAPLLIEAPWLEEPRSLDLGRLFAPVPPEARVLVARNDFVAEARRLDDRVVNGRTWRVFALDVRRIETGPGRVVLAGPRLHFARGTGFRDDFLSGRTATGRVDAFVRGSDLVLDVRPVPTEGRPANWSGAVGVFELEASASFDVTARPATARVDFVLSGSGDLATAELGGPDSFPGFRVLGTLDDRGPVRRTVRVDLELESGNVRAIAPLEFVHFDPRPPGAWRVARSSAFPLPAGATWSDVARGPADVPPSEPPGAGFAAAGSVRVLLVAALVGALVLGGAAIALARRSRG